MSTSSDGGRGASVEQSFLSSELGGQDVMEAREKMKEDIVNVNQFYPEITGGIQVYRDKYSFLGDNQPESECELKKSESQEAENQRSSGGATPSVFPTEMAPETEPRKGSQASNLLFLPEHWTSRPKELVSMRRIVEDSTAEHYKQGTVASKLESWEEALAHFNKCITLRPREAIYFVRRGEIFLQLCDFQSAILNYKRACILEPVNRASFARLAFLYLLHGQTLFDQKLYPEALESFSRAAEMQPDRVAYQTRSMACLAALQRHGECLALVNKRLESETNNCDLYVMRARLHNMFRNYSLCYYDLKDALSIDKEHREALTMLHELARRAQDFNARAVELALSGRTREALQRVSLAIEMDPTVSSFHVKRGAFHRRLGDYNAAIDDYLLALDKADHDEASPIYQDAQRQLLLTFNDFAIECFSKGYYEEAVVLLNKAIKAEKRERGLYVNRGDCFYRQGELQFALADFQQALELTDDQIDTAIHSRISLVYHRFGQSSYAAKDLADADQHFSNAIKHNPTVPQLWMARGRVRYGNNNQTEGARLDVVTALLLQPDQESAMSLVSRLFPGKTLGEVMSSQTAIEARENLETLVRGVMPHALVTVDDVRHARVRVKGPRRPAKDDNWKHCRSEREIYSEMIVDKKAIRNKLKKRFTESQSLRHTGGRVGAMAPASEHSRRGAVGKMEILVDERGKAVKTDDSGWKTFSLGIGIG